MQESVALVVLNTETLTSIGLFDKRRKGTRSNTQRWHQTAISCAWQHAQSLLKPAITKSSRVQHEWQGSSQVGQKVPDYDRTGVCKSFQADSAHSTVHLHAWSTQQQGLYDFERKIGFRIRFWLIRVIRQSNTANAHANRPGKWHHRCNKLIYRQYRQYWIKTMYLHPDSLPLAAIATCKGKLWGRPMIMNIPFKSLHHYHVYLHLMTALGAFMGLFNLTLQMVHVNSANVILH